MPLPGNCEGARAALFEVCGDILPDQTWFRWIMALRLHDQQLRYSDLQSDSDALAQIEKDVSRTFPEIDAFDAEQEQRLGRILNAYANHDVKVAYCQGMNYVAGLLLMLSDSEEEAFGVLAILMDRYGLHGFYSDGLPLLPRYVDAFCHLMQEEAPALLKHLEQEGLSTCLYLHEWFLTVFISCLPLHAVVVVWNAVIHEGLEILIPVAVSILQAWEEEILAAKFADVFTLLKSLASKFDQQEDKLQPLLKKIAAMKVPELVLAHLAGGSVRPWLRSFQERLKVLSPRNKRSTATPGLSEGAVERMSVGSTLERILSPRKRRGAAAAQTQEASRESIVEHATVQLPPSESASSSLLTKLASLSPRRRPKLKVVPAGQEESKPVVVGVVPGGSLLAASWQPGTSPEEGRSAGTYL